MTEKELIVNSSKEVIQSYILTIARRNWGIYAEKILLKLVEAAQAEINSIDFKNGGDLKPHTPSLDYPSVTKNSAGDVFVDIPVSSILPSENYKNYDHVFRGIEQLQTTLIRWDSPKTDSKGNIIYDAKGNVVRKWKSVQLIGEAEGETLMNSQVHIRVNVDIWKAMLDFSKGFRAFDIGIAMKIHKKYALRLYQLLSRQETPITFTIDELKQQWGLEKKYSRPDELIKRTIVPAKEELDAISPYTFDYILNKSNTPGRGNKPVVSITFIPKHQIQFESTRAIKGFDEVGMMLTPPIKKVLKEKYHFEWFELSAVFDLLYAAQTNMSEPDLLTFLVDDRLAWNAEKAKDSKKYIIGSIKKHLKEKYKLTIRRKRDRKRE